MGDFESADKTADSDVEDVDSKMIPDQILLSDYKRVGGNSLQVRERCRVEVTGGQVYCRMSTQMSANITTPSSGVFQPITTRRNILSHVGPDPPDIISVVSYQYFPHRFPPRE